MDTHTHVDTDTQNKQYQNRKRKYDNYQRTGEGSAAWLIGKPRIAKDAHRRNEDGHQSAVRQGTEEQQHQRRAEAPAVLLYMP
jgi:hypothetical protein